MKDTVGDRLELAVEMARQASDLILKYYQSDGLAVELKGDASPVTIADRGAEEQIRETLKQHYPQDGVLGEEFPEKPSENGFRWILDPIDGTKPFVHGVPLFGTLIALEHDGKAIMGVCRFPALDEVVYAAQGEGTWWQRGTETPKQTYIDDIDDFSDATFCITEYATWQQTQSQDALGTLVSRCKITRGWGDCYGHALVATGRAHLMVDPVMSPWDAAALVPIVLEAGGCWMDWKGNPVFDGGNGISVVPHLKDEVLRIVSSTSSQ